MMEIKREPKEETFEAEDDIVSELDVFIREPIDEAEMFVLQYPIRPSNVDYSGPIHLGARYRPKFQMLELDLMIDTEGKNYSKEKGEQMAKNVDGQNKQADDRFYESGVVDKQVLVSSQISSPDEGPFLKNYAIGCLSKDSLQIFPLRNIFHMRPSFEHLDMADELAANTAAMNLNQESDQSDEDGLSGAQRVAVKFARHGDSESEMLDQARKESFEYLASKRAEEPWCHMAYLNEQECTNLLKRVSEWPIEESTSEVNSAETIRNVLDGIVTTSVLQSEAELSAQTRLETILRKCQLISFVEYQAFSEIDVNELAQVIQQCAVFIKGDVWAFKSDLKFVEGFKSEWGADRNQLSNCRDLILYCFRRFGAVDIGKIKSVTKLHINDVHIAMEGIGKRTDCKTHSIWVPSKSLYGVDFRSMFPSVVDRQSALWDRRMKLLQDELRIVDLIQFQTNYSPSITPEATKEPTETAFSLDENKLIGSVITKYFSGRFWLKLSELKMRLWAETMKAETSISNYPDSVLMASAQREGFCHVNKSWPDKYREEPILMNFNVRDSPDIDLIRRAMYTCLLQSHKFLYRNLKDAISSLANELSVPPPSDADVKSFVKTHCTSATMDKRVWYYLKSASAQLE